MKVITVFKTHVDVGFTDLPTRVLDSYATKMLADAVETCEKTETNAEGEKFVWTLPAYPLYYALERTTEELKKRAEALIQKRRLVWHALPFTLRTEFFSKQELVDSLSYARKLSKRYGVPMPKAAKWKRQGFLWAGIFLFRVRLLKAKSLGEQLVSLRRILNIQKIP